VKEGALSLKTEARRMNTAMSAQKSVRFAFLLVVAAGCVISLTSFGVRSAFGLFTEPWSAAQGYGRDVFALAIAIQNICWGIAQPFAGALADRFGSWRVLAAGGLLYGVGTILAAYSSDPLSLHLTAGVMAGLGMGGASYVTVLGVLGRIASAEQRSWVLGIGAAAASLGQFLIVPLGQAFVDAYSWPTALIFLGFSAGSTVILALAFRGRDTSAPAAKESDLGLKTTLGAAFGYSSYLLLFCGFFVCGFQLAFITTHMPAYLTALGFTSTVAAWGIAIIGLANIAGAYLAGVLGAKYSKRNLLAAVYFMRGASIAIFILLPPSTIVLFIFCAVMGLLWLSTAPLTSGLVAVMFGTRYLTTLFSVVFFGHQIGSFMGAWLGGIIFTMTGNYDLMWWLSVLLSFFAAVLHMPIAEKAAPRFAVASP
jgi:MFS family permease